MYPFILPYFASTVKLSPSLGEINTISLKEIPLSSLESFNSPFFRRNYGSTYTAILEESKPPFRGFYA